MKTQELIKQAEELLAGIGEKEWSIFRGPYACGIAEKDGEVVLDFLADSPDSYEKAQFVAFSRNHMQELIDKLKKYEDALLKLRDCDWVITLPDRMDGVRAIARQALEEE